MKTKLLIIILLAGMSVLSYSPQASACSCAAEWDIEDDFEAKDNVIFSGKVTNITEQQRSFLVTFEIDQSWKGVPDDVDDINIMTAQYSASCGYNFADQQSYLVVAHGVWDQTPTVSLCSSTTPLDSAHEQVSFLNKQIENVTTDDDNSVLPPLKQFHSGIPFDKIQCKENLALVQKYDGLPACVYPETVPKLIERGWTEQSLPLCTSTRTACFNQESNMCDPAGWECGDNGEIFSETISLLPEPKKYSTAFPYIWNDYLHKQGIEFEPKEQSYFNTGEGWLDVNRVCSPIVTSNGTELYVSSVFIAEPFEIIGTFIDNTKPDDCYKIWKTESVLPEPDKELEVWLEIYHNKN